ncbi:MAG: peptidoglycan-binding protein [Clostridiales bacterium]|jgi:peptidoglycan hydrolase-like protein with peptidoglycan-binding domain|nr:peptidoglycan-binding protein [Clostridiales bacterium]
MSDITLPTLRKGDKGDSVKQMQLYLNANGAALATDGSFGAATETAVETFQQAKGLTVDGVCGASTWDALLDVLKGDALTVSTKLACGIIFTNEGGYGSVNGNDNGALSVGKMQWHGNRALALLKTVIAKNTSQAAALLGDALYNEIENAASAAWSTRVATAAEAKEISALLTTPDGEAAEDALAVTDVGVYIQTGMGCGLTDCGALIYFADFANQYGTASSLLKSVTQTALQGAGDVAAMFDATKAATTQYISRRTTVYDSVVALDLPDLYDPFAAQAQPEAPAPEDVTQAETTVDNAVADGLISDKVYWLNVLAGKTVPSPAYIKAILDNAHALCHTGLAGGSGGQ